VGSHYGLAPGSDMATLRKLPNTAAFCGLCGCCHGDSRFGLSQIQNEIHYAPTSESLQAVSVAVQSPAVNANETPMSDTINTGTMLIEENAYTRESLGFESEPWTRFYMAGEIIRESRKACRNQSKYASVRVDVMGLQMGINSEAQVIEEGECKTAGCGPAPASSSLPTELVNGKTSRRHWPSRTRITSPSSTFRDLTKYPRIRGWQHWVASFFDRERYCTSHSLTRFCGCCDARLDENNGSP
jgi:hypothetical protein